MLRYNIRTGVRKIKTKTFVAISTIGLVLGGGAFSLAVFSSAHAATGYSLVGGAVQQADGIHLVSNATSPYSNIDFTSSLSASATVSSLTNLDATLYKVVGDCHGGSPRFQINTSSGNLFVYLGVAPNFTSCSDGATGNLLTTADLRVDTSQISGGTFYDTWSHALTIAGSNTISDLSLIVDGSWQADQEFRVPAATINSTTFNFVPTPTLNWGSQVNASQCSDKIGAPVVNVTEKITNDADSGIAGNAWAFDNNNRQIQVWRTGADSFCAVVRYEGSFTTNAGPSPQNTGALTAGVTGTFEGGYLATFSGSLLTPTKSNHGNLRTYNYNCDTSFNCPGYHDWTSSYFSGVTNFSQDWWGWIYTANNGSVWVNSIDGNAGDITN